MKTRSPWQVDDHAVDHQRRREEGEPAGLGARKSEPVWPLPHDVRHNHHDQGSDHQAVKRGGEVPCDQGGGDGDHETERLADELPDGFRKKVVVPLLSPDVEVDEAHDGRGEAQEHQRPTQRRIAIERSDGRGEHRQDGGDPQAPQDVDRLHHPLSFGAVPVAVLDQKTIAAGVADQVEEGRGQDQGCGEPELLRTEDPRQDDVAHKRAALGCKARDEVGFCALAPGRLGGNIVAYQGQLPAANPTQRALHCGAT
jgi:hypothetical protein